MDKTTLLSYMPKYYKTSKFIDNLNDTNAEELNIFLNKIEETLNQFFIDTSSFALDRWEKEVGIEINNNYNKEFRRSRIKAKLRGQGTTTKELIKQVASSFSGGEVEVIEDNANNKFTIKFVGQLGIPANMEDLELSIEEIKPAHLVFTFEYSYRTHNTLNSYTHSQLASFNHNELREGEI